MLELNRIHCGDCTGMRGGWAIYQIALSDVVANGYHEEINWVQSIPSMNEIDPETFFREYAWCVLNAGMKEQIARKIYNNFLDSGKNPEVIGHLGKRDAIKKGILLHVKWLSDLKKRANPKSQIDFLESLPWIGPITKYHLARNIGIDCVKPDRHLVKLAKNLGYRSPLDLCEEIQQVMPDPKQKLGFIDLVLWRYCNLHGVPQ